MASEDREFKTGICNSLTRKPSYSSFFSARCTDFKNVTFEKIHWAPSEVLEVKRSFSKSLKSNFGFHLVFTSFHLKFFILAHFWLQNWNQWKKLSRKTPPYYCFYVWIKNKRVWTSLDGKNLNLTKKFKNAKSLRIFFMTFCPFDLSC